MRRRLGIVVVAALVLAVACERRVAEPGSSSGSSPAPAPKPSSQPSSQPSAQREPDPLAGRCIKPLGAEPERPMPPALDPNCPDDPGRPTLPMGKVAFERAGVTVEVELAKHVRHRQRGLMYRRELGDDEGMLFLFERRRLLTFWMKNTCIPLDMIFIDHDGIVVGISENVPTMNMNTYHVGCPSQYVLEMKAGWSRKNGVKPGDEAKFIGVGG